MSAGEQKLFEIEQVRGLGREHRRLPVRLLMARSLLLQSLEGLG